MKEQTFKHLDEFRKPRGLTRISFVALPFYENHIKPVIDLERPNVSKTKPNSVDDESIVILQSEYMLASRLTTFTFSHCRKKFIFNYDSEVNHYAYYKPKNILRNKPTASHSTNRRLKYCRNDDMKRAIIFYKELIAHESNKKKKRRGCLCGCLLNASWMHRGCPTKRKKVIEYAKFIPTKTKPYKFI